MRQLISIIKNMGFSWTIFRVKYEIKKRLKILHRKFPPGRAFSNEDFIKKNVLHNIKNENDLTYYIKNHTNFFFTEKTIDGEFRGYLRDLLSSKDKAIKAADKIIDNEFVYFRRLDIPYNKIDWHYSPLTKKKSPSNLHWLNISDLNGDFGDIKFIWELSRFPFVYDLVRAYVLTNEDKYVIKFWELIEDWIKDNKPELGVNYKCGQEMSLRVMAWLFGLYAFLNHKETTPKRVTNLLKIIYLHIDHVEKHFEFALKSVRNNHTLSEAAGMYTVGILFPFFDKADKWKRKGKKYLEKEAMWQIYDDGSYIQNSFNYHRLMLQVYTWSIRLGELNRDIFSNELKKRLKKAIIFLYQHQIELNGRVPNYGANDGALIHPLSKNDYLDYRPQLNAAWMSITGRRLYEKGQHDENILWLFGTNSLKKKRDKMKRISMNFSQGGYYTFRNKNSFGMIRCTTYKNRPGQADMLHFDLWINDKNILTDGGSYSYNTKSEILSYFRGTRSHNTIMINDTDQMQQGNRFMWLDWTKSKMIRFDEQDQYTIFEGEHYGYKPLVHKRAILNIKNHWIIVDDVYGTFNNNEENIQLSWLFGIDSINKVKNNQCVFNVGSELYKMKLHCSSNCNIELFMGNKHPFRGWQSLYYGEKLKKPQMVLTSNERKPTRFITIISKSEIVIYIKNNKLIIDELCIELLDIGEKNIFKI